MRLFRYDTEIPDYLLKSSNGVTILSIIILTPFGINNLIQGRILLGVLTLIITILCFVNSWFCLRGQYHLGVNLLGLIPAIIMATVFVFFKLGVVGSYWAYLCLLSFYFTLPEKLAYAVNLVFLAIILPLAWVVLEPTIALRFGAVLIGISVYAFVSIHEISKQHYLLKKQSVTDALTGLHNRFLLQSSLEFAIQQKRRTDVEMTLLMLDIDHFKKINDQHGHDVGDHVLRNIGEYLKKSFRGSDKVFRIGGEEFLLLIYNSDADNSRFVAEKLRREIAALELIPDHQVTVSIGVSTLSADVDWEDWMKQCDVKLYQAKADGRNKVAA
jgi:diguanylate cyclase (GGDEF)-like protein